MSKLMQALLKGPYGGRVKGYYESDGYHDVLMHGFCDDGDMGRHTIIDTSIAEVIKRIKNATPCSCESCKQK